MSFSGTPPAEVKIDEALVIRLVDDHFPEYSNLNVTIMESGWDNVMVRLGDKLALRLPRRAAAGPLIQNEQKWLPWLAPQLPLPLPVPLHALGPTDYYPFHWSLQKWIIGDPADLSPPNNDQADILANFLTQLHGIPLPDNAPHNSARDCPLSAKAPDTLKRMDDLKSKTEYITPKITQLWENALNTPPVKTASFIAGDIHARNVLTLRGKLAAIIDWGDMCAGDPATDLMGIWGLFEDKTARDRCLEIYGTDQNTLARAKGWAMFSGVILLHTGLTDNPRHAKMGADVLRRLAQDA